MNQDEQSKNIGQVLAKCWSDESFKKKLMADPVVTLKAEGVKMRDDMTVEVTENTDKVFNLVIPAKPTDLTDADLDKVAGGGGFCIAACLREEGPPMQSGQISPW